MGTVNRMTLPTALRGETRISRWAIIPTLGILSTKADWDNRTEAEGKAGKDTVVAAAAAAVGVARRSFRGHPAVPALDIHKTPGYLRRD